MVDVSVLCVVNSVLNGVMFYMVMMVVRIRNGDYVCMVCVSVYGDGWWFVLELLLFVLNFVSVVLLLDVMMLFVVCFVWFGC